MRTISILFLTFLFLFSVNYAFSQEDSIASYRQKANEAYANKDIDTFASYAIKCYEINSSSLSFVYNYASANALKNNAKEAMKTLERMLENGITNRILNDPDFDQLRETDEFKSLSEKYNKEPEVITNSTLAFEIPEKDLIPEGITYNPNKKEFLVGSIFKSKIVKVDADKNISDIVKQEEQGFVSVLGMNVDQERNILWASSCYGYLKENLPKEKLGTARIYKIDLNEGKILRYYELVQEENHFLNDIAIDKSGNIYTTDSHVPAVYTIDKEKDELIKLFDLPVGSYPNGITISEDDRMLFAATSYGIYSYNFDTKERKRLRFENDLVYSACDGLYFYKNSLIGVQGFTNRIMRFYLDDGMTNITHQKILEANNPLFETPTTGVIVDDTFFLIANAQLGKINAEGKIAPMEELNTTKVIAIQIED
jgi:sugar lactone lactonase YvrE